MRPYRGESAEEWLHITGPVDDKHSTVDEDEAYERWLSEQDAVNLARLSDVEDAA